MSDAAELLPEGLALAPVWRRVAAVVINLLIVIAGIVAAGASVFGAVKLGLTRPLAPARRLLTRRLAGWGKRLDRSSGPMRMSARTRLLIWVPSLALELDRRNWRGVGARMMGIRRVEVRTGGPISVRAALQRRLVSNGYGLITRWAVRPLVTRSRSRMKQTQPEFRELQRVHADEPDAFREARIKLYRDHKVKLSASCLGPFLRAVMLRTLPILLSQTRQGLPDRVAGIVTVRDDPTPDAHPRRSGL
jgi:hypothetical protein